MHIEAMKAHAPLRIPRAGGVDDPNSIFSDIASTLTVMAGQRGAALHLGLV